MPATQSPLEETASKVTRIEDMGIGICHEKDYIAIVNLQGP